MMGMDVGREGAPIFGKEGGSPVKRLTSSAATGPWI
jgi:hypothetical protein